jgi:hypothetical protein
MDALTADNKASLTSALGREPTDAELYLAHQQGAGGAIKLLQNPNMTPAQLGLGQAVAVNNGNPNAPAVAFTNKIGNLYSANAAQVGGGDGDTQVAANDQTGFHNVSGKASGIPGMPANTNGTPGTNGGGGFDLGKFSAGLQQLGASLMARDNPQGAQTLLSAAAAMRKAQDDASGLTYHGTTASGKNYLYTDAKGNIVTKPVAEADQADDKNTFRGMTPDGKGMIFTDPQGNPVLKPLPEGVSGISKLGTNRSTETDLTKNPPSAEELAMAAQVGNYQTPMPVAFSSRSPQAIRMRSIIATQYPDFQAQQYQTAQKTMNDASTGKLGTANNALETVTGHLDDFSTAADALNNGNIPMLNLVANKIGVQTGATPQVTINNLRQGIADELMKTYRGGGQPSERETAAFQQLLDPNASPAQMKASVGQFAEMLQSKVDANQRQYTKGMRGNADSEHGKAWSAANPLFSQDQQGTLDRLQDKGQDNEDQPRVNTPAPSAPRFAPGSKLIYNPSTGKLEPQ